MNSTEVASSVRRPIVFLGTPRAGADVLQQLIAHHDVELVITQPDKRRGRGGQLIPSAVKQVAMENDIPVGHDMMSLCDLAPHPRRIGVVVAYGRIIPTDILQTCPMINIHFSLLPRWRGAAPVERAIMAGDEETGVCIMDVEPTLDTGAVHAVAKTRIEDSDTAETLTQRLSEMGSALLLEVLARTEMRAAAQSGEPTYAHKIESDERFILWNGSGTDIWRRTRALPCFAVLEGKRVGLTEVVDEPGISGVPGTITAEGVVCAENGGVRLVRVQPEGKKVMNASDWLRGLRSVQTLCFATTHTRPPVSDS